MGGFLDSALTLNRIDEQLITMEKTAEDDGPPPTFEDHDVSQMTKVKVPGHRNFSQRVGLIWVV